MDKILIIDNEFEIVEMLSEILSGHDYDVKTALNGENGIKSALYFHPDLILCDISMPETNGYAVLKALREDDRTHAIPFIFLYQYLTHRIDVFVLDMERIMNDVLHFSKTHGGVKP